MTRFVVVATGTEVGKTHVSESVLRSLRSAGLSCVGLKPVESGVAESDRTDWQRLGQAGGRHVAPLFAFDEPVSPHLAARDAGVEIEVGRVAEWVRASEDEAGWTLVETAGGLLSPLGRGLTNLSICEALGGRLVLVAGNRLGALHDVTACMRVLAKAGWPASEVVVVLNDVLRPESRAMVTNAGELRGLGLVEHLVCFPHGEVPGSERAHEAARAIVALLEGQAPPDGGTESGASTAEEGGSVI